eukprot:tig00000448_g862.t1
MASAEAQGKVFNYGLFRTTPGVIQRSRSNYVDVSTATAAEMSCAETIKLLDYSQVMRDIGATRLSLILSPFLFLGSEEDARDVLRLQNERIFYVINADPSEVTTGSSFYGPAMRYMEIQIDEIEFFDLKAVLPAVFAFIDEAKRAGGRVLVHGKDGISRSAALVIGYVMREKGVTLARATKQVLDMRACVYPSHYFVRQLAEYEQELLAEKAASTAS